MKVFLQRILQEIMKKIILGTSDAWSTIHLSHRPSDRAWIYLRLTNFLTNQVTIYMKTNLLYISVLKSVPSIWKISIDKCLSQICNEILVQECISWHCQILTVIFLPLENFCSCKHGVFIWKITIQAFSNVTKSTVSLVTWWNHFLNI